MILFNSKSWDNHLGRYSIRIHDVTFGKDLNFTATKYHEEKEFVSIVEWTSWIKDRKIRMRSLCWNLCVYFWDRSCIYATIEIICL